MEVLFHSPQFCYSIGKAERGAFQNTAANPGPGAYDSGSKLAGPKYHFSGRHSQSMTNLAPGPGQYSPSTKLRYKITTYKYTMAGKSSFGDQKYGPPGPGTYNLMITKGQCGGKFGKDLRDPLDTLHKLAIPGPGTYESSKKASSSVAASPRFTYLY